MNPTLAGSEYEIFSMCGKIQFGDWTTMILSFIYFSAESFRGFSMCMCIIKIEKMQEVDAWQRRGRSCGWSCAATATAGCCGALRDVQQQDRCSAGQNAVRGGWRCWGPGPTWTTRCPWWWQSCPVQPAQTWQPSLHAACCTRLKKYYIYETTYFVMIFNSRLTKSCKYSFKKNSAGKCFFIHQCFRSYCRTQDLHILVILWIFTCDESSFEIVHCENESLLGYTIPLNFIFVRFIF